MDNKLTQFVFNQVGIPSYEKYLDLASFRHKLISSNVANVSTPGYKSQDIDFQTEFKKSIGKSEQLPGVTTHANHIPLGASESKSPDVRREKVKGDEMNSVNIDKEISNMAQNELRYTIGAKLLQNKFSSLSKVINSK